MFFPINAAMNKNLTINMGNCNHRTYIPKLVTRVASGETGPAVVLGKIEPMRDAIEAYKQFDLRRPGWIKVELKPGACGIYLARGRACGGSHRRRLAVSSRPT